MNWILPLALALIGFRWVAQLSLAILNRRHVQLHADGVPDPLAGVMDAITQTRSVNYTLARNSLGMVEATWKALVLVTVLFSGVLPWSWTLLDAGPARSAWGSAMYLFVAGIGMSSLGLPFDWYSQFRIEARFGFNTTTPGVWLADRARSLLLSLVLVYPLLVFIHWLVNRAGGYWWLPAWVVIMACQLGLAALSPVLIMPLFNRFTPLPDGTLRTRLMALAERAGFQAAGIQVMDGSRRSRHSNAFFTGLGRWRKIVLFDTLIDQLDERELEAVLAHEIGHYRLQHIRKWMGLSGVLALVALFALALLAGSESFGRAFGFSGGGVTPSLLLCALLSGVVTFWMTPAGNLLSRRFEYEADRYAAELMMESGSLIGALRKLSGNNLSNLTPHPVFSGFYYSHPTLLERESALRAWKEKGAGESRNSSKPGAPGNR